MIYIVIFLILLLLELAYFGIAKRFNIIDKPNERSSHKHITLRGGGIIFLLGIWVYSILLGFNYPYFLGGLTLIAIISFIDDIYSLSDRIRLVFQFSSILPMFYQFGILSFDYWWLIIIAWIVCVGIINAYNFMDGINGITGGYSLSVILPLIYINYHKNFIDPNLLYIIGISLVVFCIFNFRKRAKCFAGDVGSVSIAFIIIFIIGKLILATNNISYIMLLAIYGVDSVLTICHRIMLHESLGKAHRKHIYQLMANELHIPHTTVSAIYASLQLIISMGLIMLPINSWLYSVLVLIVLCIYYIAFIKKYYHLHEAYLKERN